MRSIVPYTHFTSFRIINIGVHFTSDARAVLNHFHNFSNFADQFESAFPVDQFVPQRNQFTGLKFAAVCCIGNNFDFSD